MATAVETSTYVSLPINNVLYRGLLSAARRVLPFFHGTLPGTIEEQSGTKTIKWQRLDNLAPRTSTLPEITSVIFGMGRTPVTPTETNITKALAHYGSYMYLSEQVDLFNINVRAAQLLDNLGENAGVSLNILAATEFQNSTAIKANGVSTASSVITYLKPADVRVAVNNLNRNSAMKFFLQGTGSTNIDTKTVRSSYFGICHSDTEEDIRSATGFIPVEQYGGYTSVRMNEFGALGGVRWVSSEICPINTGASVNTASDATLGRVFRAGNGTTAGSAINNSVYSSFVYGREAIGTVALGDEFHQDISMGGDVIPAIEVVSSPKQVSVADPYGEISVLTWKAWFAAKVLNGNWTYEIEHLVRNARSAS